MTINQKAWSIMQNLHGCQITQAQFNNAPRSFKNELVRQATYVVDEILSIGVWISEDLAEQDGFEDDQTEEYWKAVKDALRKLI